MVLEAGMDPWEYISTKDSMKRELMTLLSDEIAEREAIRTANLATDIANKVLKGLSG